MDLAVLSYVFRVFRIMMIINVYRTNLVVRGEASINFMQRLNINV